MYYIIGIDEVGRGCLAGPVTVTAVAVPVNFSVKGGSGFGGQNLNSKQNFKFKDSKKLSAKQREEWFEYIKQYSEILYCTSNVSPKIIDKINISTSANLAAYRAVKNLIEIYSPRLNRRGKLKENCKLFLDGGLYIKNKKFQAEFFANAETVIKGDEKIEAISLASIVAKVSRDRHMVQLHKKYPEYLFDVHKGYGTKSHREAIRRHGPSSVHRLTFCGKYHNIKF